MVALLHLLSIAALAVSHVVANPAPVDAIHGLLARQSTPSPFDASQLPEQCKKDCSAVIEGLKGCASIGCICRDATISNLAKCLSCSVRVEGSPYTVQTAQETLDNVVRGCDSIGSSVKGATISANAQGNSAARTSTLSAGAAIVVAFGAVLAVA